MDQTEANLVIEWFIDLEDRLKKFLRTVPINWNHRAILPLLSGIITEAGGLVDSILRKEYDLSGSNPDGHPKSPTCGHLKIPHPQHLPEI